MEGEFIETADSETSGTPVIRPTDTPQADFVDTPQAESLNTPQAESSNVPQAEFIDAPEAESGDTRQAESPDAPQAESVDTPLVETLDAAPAETLDSAPAETLDAAQAESLEAAQAEFLEAAQAESLDAGQVESFDVHHIGCLDAPDADSLDVPKAEFLDTAQLGCLDVPDAESLDTPQIGCLDVPDAESLDTPQIGCLVAPDAESLDVPTAESLERREIGCLDAPDAESIDVSTAESPDTLRAESIDMPQAESLDMPQVETTSTTVTQSVDIAVEESICFGKSTSLDTSSDLSTIESADLSRDLSAIESADLSRDLSAIESADLSSELPKIVEPPRELPPIVPIDIFGQLQKFPPMVNDNILTTIRSRQTEPIPVWIMKQTARYLPEFRTMCTKHGYLNICHNPSLATAATLLPMEIFDLDAAMVFSNMLNVPEALGMELIMHPKAMFPRRLCIDELPILEIEGAIDRLKHVGETIMRVRYHLNGTATVFGFSGAPWTLMSYMIEGRSSDKYSAAKKWFYMHKSRAQTLLETLADVVADFCIMQARAGAQVIQLYDHNAEYLDKATYLKMCIPGLKLIREKVRTELLEYDIDVPMGIYIKRPTCLKELAEAGYDVISLDWSTNPASLDPELKNTNICLQGNLDPCVLYGTPETIREKVFEMLNKFDGYRVIANLGEAIYKDIPVENVQVFIDAVRSYRRKLK